MSVVLIFSSIFVGPVETHFKIYICEMKKFQLIFYLHVIVTQFNNC